MDSFLYIPTINPVPFYNEDLIQPMAYQTKQFDDYKFIDRVQPWQNLTQFNRIWQTTDIISLQFVASFDPIVIELLNQFGQTVISLSALTKLPDKNNAGMYAFEVQMSLAGLQTGCYRLRGTFGTGDGKLTMYTPKQYISSEPLENSILINYYNNRYFKDVIFETGIQFMIRVNGYFDDDKSTRAVKQEQYRNQSYSNRILSSKSARNVPVYFKWLSPDLADLIEQVFECNNVTLDGKLYGLAENSKIEYIEAEKYRLRGMKLILEPNLNRSSRVYALNANTNLPLFVTAIVDAKVFGDTSNQGSSNTVPIYNNQII